MKLQINNVHVPTLSLPESRPQRDNGCTSEDTIGETGIRTLSVPHLESMAVVHAGCAEMAVSCSCGIDRQIHHYNNPDVLIAISCEVALHNAIIIKGKFCFHAT